MAGSLKTVAVIPVRMGSSRLPGKVMIPILGKPLLGYLIDRLEQCLVLDDLVVATSVDSENDSIERYCHARNVPCFRGSEEDVLDRLLNAVRWREAVIGVLVFGDCPLIDPTIVADVIDYFRCNPTYNFVGNDLHTTYPPGMEVEVFTVDALADSARRCTDPVIREHGTLFIRTHPDIYKIHNIEAPQHWKRPDIILEVDTIEDLTVMGKIIRQFAGRTDFSLNEIIDYMDQNPRLRKINQNIYRRWKPFRGQ